MSLYTGMHMHGDVIVFLVFIIWVALSGVVVRYRRRHRKLEAEGASVLMSYYTQDVMLFPLKSGKLGDMHYTAIAAIPKLGQGGGGQSALLYRVELPFHSQVHLVGITRLPGNAQLHPAGRGSRMEQVDLEGDYHSYFSLFTERGMQTQVRYVLDPKAMAFTVDFCRSHNWEILGSDLYFVQAAQSEPEDPTDMADDIARFIHEIEPAISAPLTPKEIRLRTPYVEERRTDIICPLCDNKLENHKSYLACPADHGFLVRGGVLSQINRGTIVLSGLPTRNNISRNSPIVCPSCGKTMEQVLYNGGKTMIDSCKNCPYRWLDAGEATHAPA